MTILDYSLTLIHSQAGSSHCTKQTACGENTTRHYFDSITTYVHSAELILGQACKTCQDLTYLRMEHGLSLAFGVHVLIYCGSFLAGKKHCKYKWQYTYFFISIYPSICPYISERHFTKEPAEGWEHTMDQCNGTIPSLNHWHLLLPYIIPSPTISLHPAQLQVLLGPTKHDDQTTTISSFHGSATQESETRWRTAVRAQSERTVTRA